MPTPPLLVVLFSDVDSILRDSSPSAPDVAAAVFDVAAREQVPLVFYSSRTRAELECLYGEWGVSHPFIAENGAGAFIPRGYFGRDISNARDVAQYQAVDFARPHAEVVDMLRRTAARLGIGIVGFSDLSAEDIAHSCHLPVEQARLRKLREYDEPFRILDGDANTRRRLFAALEAAGLRCTSGRHYERAGAVVDPAASVGFLCDLFRRAFGAVRTLGLGNGLNDLTVLGCMDVPIIARYGAMGVTLPLLSRIPNARLVTAANSEGWTTAILEAVRGVRQHGAPAR